MGKKLPKDVEQAIEAAPDIMRKADIADIANTINTKSGSLCDVAPRCDDRLREYIRENVARPLVAAKEQAEAAAARLRKAMIEAINLYGSDSWECPCEDCDGCRRL